MSPKQRKAENSHRTQSPDAVLEQIIARHVAEAMARYEESHNHNDKKTNDGTRKRKRNDRSGQQSEKSSRNSKAHTVTSTKPNTYQGNKPKCGKCIRHHEGKCDYCNNCKRWGHPARLCKINPPTRINNDTRPYTATVTEQREYLGNKPKCGKCNRHHVGGCICCSGCKRWGHVTQACRSNPPPRGNNDRQIRACFECGDLNHFRNQCPKINNNRNNNRNNNKHRNKHVSQPAKGRAIVIGAQEARQNPNTVSGTFLMNNHYVSVLFDSSTDLSFVSTDFRPLLELESPKLDSKYTIKLADGKLIESGEIVPGCTLVLEGHFFEIDLLPVELESSTS